MNSTADGWDKLPIYVLYSVQGLIISVGNIFIALSIIRHEALRTSKEYLLMFGLSLADSVNMTGFWTAGTHRIYLVLAKKHNHFLTSWQCATKLHNLFLSLGLAWANIMLLLFSVDRLICVWSPLRYIGYTRSYSHLILGLGFGFSVLYSLAYYAIAYAFDTGEQFLPAPCYTYGALKVAPAWVSALHQSLPSVLAFWSVLIYLGVWYKHKRHMRVADGSADHNAEQLERQHKLTVTLALSCLFTFVLFCVPMNMANLLLSLGYSRVSIFLYYLSTFNPLCNVFLYQIRHKEMRIALQKLFSRETLPLDIRMWTTNQRAHEQLDMKDVHADMVKGKQLSQRHDHSAVDNVDSQC